MSHSPTAAMLLQLKALILPSEILAAHWSVYLRALCTSAYYSYHTKQNLCVINLVFFWSSLDLAATVIIVSHLGQKNAETLKTNDTYGTLFFLIVTDAKLTTD